jgi:hypothetical protein
MTSAHMIVKGIVGSPGVEQVQELGKFFLAQTSQGMSVGTFIYTQVKYLRAVKGAAGSVRFKHEKKITVYLN